MRKTFLSIAVLTVLAGALLSARPGAACGTCTRQNVQHIKVNCAACDTELDIYPPQKGVYTSCNLYAPRIVDCCNDPKTPESSSINQGACSGSCGPGISCTISLPSSDSTPAASPATPAKTAQHPATR